MTGVCCEEAETCSLQSQMDSLIGRQKLIDVELRAVQRCLEVISADAQLSDSSVDAVRQAKQHINSCLQAACTVSSQSITDSHVCVITMIIVMLSDAA